MAVKTNRVKIDSDGWLIIDTGYGKIGSYDVEPSRINTEAKCFGWARHLSEKLWMTSEMMSDLIHVLDKNLSKIKAKRSNP